MKEDKLSRDNIENFMDLTSMQQGILFYYINNNESKEYHEQLSLTITGDVKLDLLQKAWDAVIENNEMLRTVFRWQEIDKPIQIVLKNHKVLVQYIDFSNELSKIVAVEKVKAKDFNNRIDITKETLRTYLCKLEENKYEMIIANHHIIYDGWSNGIILKELMEAYSSSYKNIEPNKINKTKFSEFIKYTKNLDKNKQRDYWSNYLMDLEGKDECFSSKEIGVFKEISYKIDQVKVNKIKDFTKENRILLSSILYGVWGVLGQKLNNSNEVLFGTTVSGRPEVIKSVDNMVGIFINTVPLRVKRENNTTLIELIRKVNRDLNERKDFENTSLIDIKDYFGLVANEEFFNSLVSIENYPLDSKINKDNILSISKFDLIEKTNYNMAVEIVAFDGIEFKFNFNGAAISESIVEKFGGYCKRIIDELLHNKDIRVSEIDILSEAEKEHILNDFKGPIAYYPKDKTVQELFESQVEETPNKIAAEFGDKKLTYIELNEKANQIANHLRTKGLERENVVAILHERSIEMLVEIIAIFKAGGSYVSIDLEYPKERIQTILKDSGSKFVFISNSILDDTNKLDEYVYDTSIKEVLSLDENKIISLKGGDKFKEIIDIENYSLENLKVINDVSDLAYVIYTSGSTGNPKGVMLEHIGMMNHLWAKIKDLNLDENTIISQNASHCFDISVWQFWVSLMVGGKVIIYPNELIYDPSSFIKRIKEDKVTVLEVVPSYMSAILDYLYEESNEDKNLESLKWLVTTGEALTPSLANKWLGLNTTAKIVNAYGPTEASDDITHCIIDKRLDGESVSIGRTIQNLNIYIVDKNMNLCPIGIKGEICVSGIGVGRGYLNNKEKTKKVFTEDPFNKEKGIRLYRTGDLGGFLPDGKIEFLGRIDNQVKIRGFRIELGEIENRLLKRDDIKDAVVLAKSNGSDEKYLCAYVVSDKTVDISEIRSYLESSLPEYMVPSYFLRIDKMPLTPNGKINRKALPEIKVASPLNKYEAPRTEVEEILVKVWSEVLGSNDIGINDKFFDLGGDSIKAIRLISKLSKYGYVLDMKDLFKYGNIKNISDKVKLKNNDISQDEVKGNVKLSPVQQWFFESDFKNKHHWNQAVNLFSKENIDENIVRKVFNKIIEHHDALRMIFTSENGEFTQFNRGIKENLYSLELIDLKESEDCDKITKDKCNEIQRSIDLSKGPFVKLGLFKTKEGDHLTIVIHHLVVDGVSWRILLEDFSILYNAEIEGTEVKIQEKTSSFKSWVDYAEKYSNSKAIASEVEYWKMVEDTNVVILPKDKECKDNMMKYAKAESIALSKEENEKLLINVNRAYNTEINDILITALGLTISEFSGNNNVLVNMEGHGRYSLGEDIDISRTIGWFTSEYPVVIKTDIEKGLGENIKEVKEQMRKIPNKGIGYSLIKYLSNDQLRKEIKFNLKPEISFNYLGEFDNENKMNNFNIYYEDLKNTRSEESQNVYSLDFECIVLDCKMNINLLYNSNEYELETIKEILTSYKKNLVNIVEHCSSKENSEVTISDITEEDLDINELNSYLEGLDI